MKAGHDTITNAETKKTYAVEAVFDASNLATLCSVLVNTGDPLVEIPKGQIILDSKGVKSE